MVSGASLIISIYNQARELELILLRLIEQSVQGFEVILADDGSTAETAALVAEYRRRCPFPIKHCWQEHRGYRLAVILNKASLLAETDYLIYLNGDCLPHRRYVEGHLRLRRADRVLNGRRGVMVQPALAKRLTPVCVAGRGFDRWAHLLWWSLRGDARSVERGIRIGNPLLRRLLVRDHDNLIGADFSLFKEAMFRVNGFDETMADLGGSDRELGHRLKLLGLRLVNTRHLTITYHLEHPRPARAHPQGDMALLLAQNRNPVCRQGIRVLASGSEIGALLKARLAAAVASAAPVGGPGRM
jgi:glycosyltransferase involved in cell wall biosynthesis